MSGLGRVSPLRTARASTPRGCLRPPRGERGRHAASGGPDGPSCRCRSCGSWRLERLMLLQVRANTEHVAHARLRNDVRVQVLALAEQRENVDDELILTGGARRLELGGVDDALGEKRKHARHDRLDVLRNWRRKRPNASARNARDERGRNKRELHGLIPYLPAGVGGGAGGV